MLRHSIEGRAPSDVSAVPTHYGQSKVHPNYVAQVRARARRLARMLARSLSRPVFITRDTRTISRGIEDRD